MGVENTVLHSGPPRTSQTTVYILIMLRPLKQGTLKAAGHLGICRIVAGSRWRGRRLVILCYHGVALRDEHLWHSMFMTPAVFHRRLEILARGRHNVLPLDAAIRMLRDGGLPPKSVVITFDDGFQDFHQVALPALRKFGFPATVYQTTYYCDHPYPIFNLVLSYLFWLGSARQLNGSPYGLPRVFRLACDIDRRCAVNAFRELARQLGYDAARKNQLAARIAEDLGVDYAEIVRLGVLRLMTPDQVADIAAKGFDVQLHTHRHRTPVDKALFLREIRDNRTWLAKKTGKSPRHFCYPSGIYHSECVPWLRGEQVLSATTCDYGLASPASEPLLLPRFLDGMQVTECEFQAWLAGVGSFLPRRSV